jgi:hypothetical protein
MNPGYRILTDQERGVVDLGGGNFARILKRVDPRQVAAILERYNGWLTETLIKMFMTQSFAIPLFGVWRTTLKTNIAGYRAQNLATWFNQIIQSLEAGGANRSSKDEADDDEDGTNPTAPSLSGYPSIGNICTVTEKRDDILKPFPVNHFPAGTPTQMDYTIFRTAATCSWFCLHVDSDRGAGVPSARTDLDTEIPAASLTTGGNLRIESVNLRELVL